MKHSRLEKLFIFYLAITVSILILIKVFIYDPCYAFDSNDDVNHTFVNLKASQDIMQHGSIPEINLYNNFGTPIIGDALTFPFSIQSITYWLLPNYLAMTVNRAIIAFLTIIFLFLFFRTFLSPLSAMFSSLLVFLSPGVFWNFAHHHYQMALLCFSFILFIQNKCSCQSRPRVIDIFLLWIGYTVFFLSVSIQPVLLSLPFLVLFIPIKDRLKSIRTWILNISMLISAAILTSPQTYLFLKSISGSTRAHWSPYSGLFTTERQQLLSLLLPAGEWMHIAINGHFAIATYFSIAFLLFTIAGFLSLLKEYRKNFSVISMILLLGVVPLVLGFILQFYGQSIPFVKSMDLTRLWWFAMPFLAIAIGKLIDSDWKKDFHNVFKILAGLTSLALIFVYFSIDNVIPEFSSLHIIHTLAFLGTALCLLAVFFSIFRDKKAIIGNWLVILTMFLVLIPTLVYILGLNIKSCNKGNHYFSYENEATFQPASLLSHMTPGLRMATRENAAVEGHDLKAIFGGILGSNARAIVASEELKDIFYKNHLIKLDDTYFFTQPWQTDKLDKLGIRYLLLRKEDKDLENRRWQLIASDIYSGEKYFLYENPSKATPVYIMKDGKPLFISDFKLVPNGIRVEIPQITEPTLLVATFFPSDPWRAFIDGRETRPSMSELGMMQIPINPNNRSVLFVYRSLKPIHLIFAFLLSIAILSATIFLNLRNKYAQK